MEHVTRGQGRGIQSIEVGGRILTALVAASEPMMLRDLASAAEVAPAQCHAYLVSYRHIGLVEQDQQTGFYRLGAFALRLGLGRIRSVPILDRVSRGLAHLSSELGHMALMIVWGPHGPTIAQVQNGSSALTLNLRQGALFSLTGTASGHVFAAFRKGAEIRRQIDLEFSGNTDHPSVGRIPQRASFRAAVKLTRARGFGVAEGAPIPGVNAISAPIFEENGDLVAAVTLIDRVDALQVAPNTRSHEALMAMVSSVSTPAIE